ncbi:MAG: ABC transporter substrate-binding protein, partial [Candidatus Magasanikbacteria bacterium]|nr:ABC transporter substrate-binding protein [Candidatus Magasanikbacteria bacterium]
MRKIIFVILFLSLTGCTGKTEGTTENIKKEPIKMEIFWGLPVGIAEAMKPFLLSDLKELGIEATINNDIKNININFDDIINNEIIVAGDLASMLILKYSEDWRLVGRLSDYRVGVLVPQDSNISTFKELAGKKIAGNIAVTKSVKKMSEANGLDMETSFNFVPMDDEGMRNIILGGNKKDWGGYEAVIVPDGLMAYFEVKGVAKVIEQDTIVLPILARNSFMQENPEAMYNFFQALVKSLSGFRKNMIAENKFLIDGMPSELATQIHSKTYENEENFDE